MSDEHRGKRARDARNAVALLRTVHHEDRAGFEALIDTIEDPVTTTVILAEWLLGSFDIDPSLTPDEVLDRLLREVDKFEEGE